MKKQSENFTNIKDLNAKKNDKFKRAINRMPKRALKFSECLNLRNRIKEIYKESSQMTEDDILDCALMILKGVEYHILMAALKRREGVDSMNAIAERLKINKIPRELIFELDIFYQYLYPRYNMEKLLDYFNSDFADLDILKEAAKAKFFEGLVVADDYSFRELYRILPEKYTEKLALFCYQSEDFEGWMRIPLLPSYFVRILENLYDDYKNNKVNCLLSESCLDFLEYIDERYKKMPSEEEEEYKILDFAGEYFCVDY